MKVQTEVTVMFDSIEFNTLNRVAPSIRVAFPADEIDQAVLDRSSGPRDRVKHAKQQWAGRHLNGVCSRRDRFDNDTLHSAWEQLCHLIDVLTEQSTREYWEADLETRPVPRELSRVWKSGAPAGGVSALAPGTDICGVLAEVRQQMLHNAEEAAPILYAAVRAVGPRPEVLSPPDLRVEGV